MKHKHPITVFDMRYNLLMVHEKLWLKQFVLICLLVALAVVLTGTYIERY